MPSILRPWAAFALVLFVLGSVTLRLPAQGGDEERRAWMRTLATQLKNDLRLIDAAIDQYSIEFSIALKQPVTLEQISRYFKPGTRLADRGADPLGTPYSKSFTVGVSPEVPAASAAALKAVADSKFWAPFEVGPAVGLAGAQPAKIPPMPPREPASASPAPMPAAAFDRARMRSIATSIKNDLRLIDGAIDQYAIEFNLATGSVRFEQLKQYFRADSKLAVTAADALGNKYPDSFRIPAAGASTSSPDLRVPAASRAALADVVDNAFWSPFQ